MDLITIKREAIEVPPSQRLERTVHLTFTSTSKMQETVDKVIQDLAANGYPLHRLSFENGHTDEDGEEHPPRCIIELSRMETEEETAARVKRQEAYNQKQIEDERKRLQALDRRKELERITGHLTLEQLQAMPSIEAEPDA
jgi:outer membrane protein assembly factor BamA